MNTPLPWRIDWTEALSVGIPELDAEHQHFIGLANEFNTAIRQRAEIGRVKALMWQILQETRDHFAHEEQLLEEFDYADREQHADLHRNIVKTLETHYAALSESSPEPEWIKMGLQTRDILVRHLLEEDLKFRCIGTLESAWTAHRTLPPRGIHSPWARVRTVANSRAG